MKVMPHFSHILAKDGFSDRKPKPGWIASAPVISQAEIIALLKRLQAQFDTACLFITHDLRLVERFCQRVLVMEHGRIVETATVSLPLRLHSPAGQALQQAVLPPFPATLLNEAMPCSA